MQVFIVGGAVRDTLLGLEPKDLDFVVVGSTPEEMIAKGFTQVGADFPVFLDKNGDEFALARTERKSGAGHRDFVTEFDPTVSLVDDLIRRDLTINAMAVPVEDWEGFVDHRPATFNVIDPFGGIKDLKEGKLRHVSKAFAEDPLRVLRVARFAARFNFKIVDETFAMMRRIVKDGELDNLTSERVWKEMSRAMMEDAPHRFFGILFKLNALPIVVGEAELAFSALDSILEPLAREDASDIQRWMAVFFDSDADQVEAFIEKHVLPTEIVKAIRFGISMTSAFFHGSHDVMQVCKRFQLWQNRDLMEELSDMIHVLQPNLSSRFDTLLDAIQRAGAIGFGNLPMEDQKMLTGQEIGSAINARRLEIIVEWQEAA